MLQDKRNSIQGNKFILAILESENDFCCHEIKNFDCGRTDLNEFFRDDAFAHKKQLLAETYYLQPKKATENNLFVPVAFVSFLNDSITITKEERKTEKKNLSRYLKKAIPFPKRNYSCFPAVKIGRLGVLKKYQRKGFGTSLLNMTKDFFLTNNRTGCRFLTVDAYSDDPTIKFYQDNGFQLLWEKDKNDETRIMFFDLMRHEVQS